MALHFTDDNFEQEVSKSDLPVLVDFYAEWCGPCKMLGPVIEELSKEFEGKWKIGKVNVDECPKISEEFIIQSIPTIVLFKEGKAYDKLMGFRSKEELIKKLTE